MKVVEVRSSEGEAAPGDREPGAIETGAAAAGCGLGCVREIIWIGILLIVGYALLATCTGMD